MTRLKMHSQDLTAANITRIRELFPGCVTETRDKHGHVKLAVDFDLLKQELSHTLVEGPQERYHLNWPGKRAALLAANAPIAKTLRPCREESVNFDTTQNLFIEGDNLDALKLLQETYLGKIKMIYIDPPYNTGKDFIYKDNFAEDAQSYLQRSGQKEQDGGCLVANTESNGRYHSDWLSMIYPRLRLARNLLREDGVIFISIDDNEIHNLQKLCDEVFGADNFVSTLIWERAYAPKNDAKYVSSSHDYILMYAKSKGDFKIGRLLRTEAANSRYKNPDNDPRGVWKPSDLSVKTYNPEYDYPITTPSGRVVEPPAGRCWSLSKKVFLERLQDNRIYFGDEGNSVPCIKRFLTELKFEGMVPASILFYKEVGHSQEGAKEVTALLEEGAFDGPKPVRLLSRLLMLANVGDGDVILDFFAGSSTTAHAVMQKNSEDGGNRKFIMVQLPDPCLEKSEAFRAGYKTIAEISKERIRRAGQRISSEQRAASSEQRAASSEQRAASSEQRARLEVEKSKSSAFSRNISIDVGFRVLRIDTSNMADVYYTPDVLDQANFDLFVDNIKPDRTAEDLLFQVMLDWGVDLTLPIKKKNIQGKDVFFVDDDALAACFDAEGSIDEAFVKALAAYKPLRVVFRDSGFRDSAVKINVEQIFKLLSPVTEVKSL